CSFSDRSELSASRRVIRSADGLHSHASRHQPPVSFGLPPVLTWTQPSLRFCPAFRDCSLAVCEGSNGSPKQEDKHESRASKASRQQGNRGAYPSPGKGPQ